MSSEGQEESFISRITKKISQISPVRLVLMVSATYYVIKNLYIYQITPRAPIPDLPHDHEERVHKQFLENMKRGGGQILAILVLVAIVFGLRFINNRDAQKDEQARKKDEEIKHYEEMLEEVKANKKRILEDAALKKKKKNQK